LYIDPKIIGTLWGGYPNPRFIIASVRRERSNLAFPLGIASSQPRNAGGSSQ